MNFIKIQHIYWGVLQGGEVEREVEAFESLLPAVMSDVSNWKHTEPHPR